MNKYRTILKLFFTCFMFLAASAFSGKRPGRIMLQQEQITAEDSLIRIGAHYFNVSIHLPENYSASKTRYPVFYVLLPESNSDEMNNIALDSVRTLYSVTPGIILAGIRSLKDSLFQPVGEELYPEMIAMQFKPWIDKKYRTIPSMESTVVSGFSSSAPMAMILALKYASVFGRSGIFSPDFTGKEDVEELVMQNAASWKGMMFIHSYEGDKTENGTKLQNLLDNMAGLSAGLIYNYLDSGEKFQYIHKPVFREFYNWILSNGHNYIIKPSGKKKGRA